MTPNCHAHDWASRDQWFTEVIDDHVIVYIPCRNTVGAETVKGYEDWMEVGGEPCREEQTVEYRITYNNLPEDQSRDAARREVAESVSDEPPESDEYCIPFSFGDETCHAMLIKDAETL